MSGAVHGLLALVVLAGGGIILWYMIGEAKKPGGTAATSKSPATAPAPKRSPGANPAPNRNGGSRPARAPVPQGPNIHALVNDLNVAILSREAARYRKDRSAEKRYDRLATDARRKVSEAAPMFAEVPTHMEPLDKIVAIDDTDLRKTARENASEVLDRTLKKVGKDQLVKVKVDRYGTETELYIFFPMIAKGSRVAVGGSNRITITKDFALEIQREVLSLPPTILGMKERKKIDQILGRGEATEEEYAYLTRRVSLRSASSIREEKTQFVRQLARLESVLDTAPVADAVVKQDGGRVKGKIVASDNNGVTIDTTLGTTVTIPRRQVRFERTAEQLRNEFRGRLAAAEEYLDALPQLLVWTREWEMTTHREYVAFRMLKRNPHDRIARMTAGYHQSPDGKWVLGERRPVAKRPETKVELKPELETMGFQFKDGKWYSKANWSVGIDNLHRRPNYPLAMRGTKIYAWHLDDTPQARIIDGSGKVGKAPKFKGSPRLRFIAPVATTGTASITLEAPGEIVECQVKAPGEIVSHGSGGGKIETFVTAAGGTATPIYKLEQGRNEMYWDITFQVRGKRKFTITAHMSTVRDDYHTYARWIPCLPETKRAFWVRGKILKHAPEIDTIWRNAK